jgi:hypothetical protein
MGLRATVPGQKGSAARALGAEARRDEPHTSGKARGRDRGELCGLSCSFMFVFQLFHLLSDIAMYSPLTP